MHMNAIYALKNVSGITSPKEYIQRVSKEPMPGAGYVTVELKTHPYPTQGTATESSVCKFTI